MNHKALISVIIYFLAVSINFMPSIKYPDLNLSIFNIIGTLLFMILLLFHSKKGSKKLIVISTVGLLSGILLFLITSFEHILFDNVILDSIASIQYPFYLIFITPLFGGNLLFNLSHGEYSLFMSLFYGIVLGLTIYFRKTVIQSSLAHQ